MAGVLVVMNGSVRLSYRLTTETNDKIPRPPHAPAVSARASCLIILGVNISVSTGPRREVTTMSTSTALNILSSSNRTPAALRML